jgi:ribosome-associated toxin RatA of RatAB toxin-antitoxin module
MPTISASVVVPARAEEIFDFIADYRNIPVVQPHFTSARLLSHTERGVGAIVELQGQFHGMPLHVRNRIITYVPPRRMVSMSDGAVLSRNSWELEPVGDDPPATRVTFTLDYKMSGALGGLFGGLMAPFFHREMQSLAQQSLTRLRQIFHKRPEKQVE